MRRITLVMAQQGTGSRVAAASLLVVFCVLLLPPFPFFFDLVWLIGLTCGYGAAVLLIVLLLLPFRRLAPNLMGRISFAQHRDLAVACLVLAVLHVLVLIAADPTVSAYLLPSAPRHMLAADIAILLLALLVASSFNALRDTFFGRYFPFRPIHFGASIAVVLLTCAHVVGSGIYMNSTFKIVLWFLICAAAVASQLRAHGLRGERGSCNTPNA